jgi:2-polyprenyl-3-methyl-5-hydroxy-6-metoxy-1,4-benzoquinol methylase
MHIMDFGSGTGLLLEQIAPHVGKIIAVDVSPSTNTQLREKQSRLPCETEIQEVDLERAEIAGQFDGIVSSMTMHHISDVEAMFRKFHGMVKVDGFIAIADLDLEDGSFHTEDTGVFHTGFERAAIADLAAGAGFRSVVVSSASVVRKPQGDYGVFLLTGIR